MRFFCGKNRGAISVFLTLILVPVLVFSGIIVDASRLYASKTVISGAGDLTMNAALAAYDKKLKDSYGLIAMSEDPASPSVTGKMEQYFKESCNASFLQDENNDDLHSMIQLELGENGLNLKGVEDSSLADTQVLQQQIMEYMKFRAPVYMITDILEKFRKLPLQNMKEKKEYIDAKSKYGKALQQLGEPSQKAKDAVDGHSAAISQVTEMAKEQENLKEEYKQQTVFWLAARSLEQYLNGNLMADVGGGQISVELIRYNLSGAEVWDQKQTTFDQTRYDNLVAALSLYQYSDIVTPVMQVEENGFTEEDWQKYLNIGNIVQQSIDNMDAIYRNAVQNYKDGIEKYKSEIQTIIDTGEEGQEQLQELLNVWETKVEPTSSLCEQKKGALRNKGEDLTDLEELEEEENLDINTADVQELIKCLSMNVQTAQQNLTEAEQLQELPAYLDQTGVTSGEAEYLHDYNASDAVQIFWGNHPELDEIQETDLYYSDPKDQKFYIEYLSKIESGEENSEQKNKKAQAEADAEASQSNYQKVLDFLQSRQNLEEYEGISFPSEFPSGLGKEGSDINSSKRIGKIRLDKAENTVDDMESGLSAITELVQGLDKISGELLERAYLMEYMTEMFNCLTTKEDAISLSGEKLNSHYINNGEIEYLLYGNSDTAVNKEQAISVLYSLRLAINSVYVFFDKELNREANAIAQGIATSTGQVWLYPIVKYAYLFCRAVIYSGQEIFSLAQGESVAVWRGKDEITLSYLEYLKLFILVKSISTQGERKLLVRTGDCIQLNYGKKLSDRYTMLTLQADVKSTTTFLPRVPAFLGRESSDGDGKKVIHYQGIQGY